MITIVYHKMRFLSILAIFTLSMNVLATSKCNENCIEKQQFRELAEKCNYAMYNFPDEDNCFPSNYYQNLYVNQTTFDELREQCKYYKNQLSFIVEMYFYIFILSYILILFLFTKEFYVINY